MCPPAPVSTGLGGGSDAFHQLCFRPVSALPTRVSFRGINYGSRRRIDAKIPRKGSVRSFHLTFAHFKDVLPSSRLEGSHFCSDGQARRSLRDGRRVILFSLFFFAFSRRVKPYVGGALQHNVRPAYCLDRFHMWATFIVHDQVVGYREP